MLKKVLRPDGREVRFEYDALGRRTAKVYDGSITRWVWDGNTPLHEWTYAVKERPKVVVDELGEVSKDKSEPTANLVSWLFDEGTFKPAAKLKGGELQSILTDYLGTPVEMLDEKGKQTWSVEYDVYGKVRKQYVGKADDCPFRYQGQYKDEETGLYYNRFRYYDGAVGAYISRDPLNVKGGFNVYAYVDDTLIKVDRIGLSGYLFRGDDGYVPGTDLGTPIGSDADVTTPWEHVRKESNQTSSFTSFSETRKETSKFTDSNNFYKVSKEELAVLEKEAKIKIHTPESVEQMMKASGDKKLMKDAKNVRQIMEKNGEVLIEGVIEGKHIKCA